MSTEMHWQIALNQFCPIPPRGTGYDNTSRWLTDRAPMIFSSKEDIDEMIEIIDEKLISGEYSVLKYLSDFKMGEHTKIKHITIRRKALGLVRSRKMDDVIKLHLSGMKNFEICEKLNTAKEYVSMVVSRYKENNK